MEGQGCPDIAESLDSPEGTRSREAYGATLLEEQPRTGDMSGSEGVNAHVADETKKSVQCSVFRGRGAEESTRKCEKRRARACVMPTAEDDLIDGPG